MKQSTQSSYYPIAADNLHIEETGNEVIVFDSRAQLFHFLNETAYCILKACNGSNSIKDLAAMLSAKFNFDDMDVLTNDVTETISHLRDKGLIVSVVDVPHQHHSALGAMTDSTLLAVSVSGSSMFPVLLSGDKVLVKKSSVEDLKAGDIIVWSHESIKLVAHRILSIDLSSTPPLITTIGDRAVDPDPPVKMDRVLGKIVAVLREGGVQWMTTLDGNNRSPSSQDQGSHQGTPQPTNISQPKPSYRRMQVLDLRDISVESIRDIESVDEVSLVLLSPENAHAWSDVSSRNIKSVFTVPEGYRVYTGQPELLPEVLEFLQAPLRLVISGQLFLTAFEPDQILKAFKEVLLNGQAYVSSAESKISLESVTKIVSGEICVVPNEHFRWIGPSILGPEYASNGHHQPIVVVGDLAISQRMDGIPDGISLFWNSGGNQDGKTRADN